MVDSQIVGGSGPLMATLTEASQHFRVSTRTLRRLINAGKLVSARKQPGPTGETWHVDLNEVAGLGYEPKEQTGAAGGGSSEVAPRTDLTQIMQALEPVLKQLDEANTGWRQSAAEAATLKQQNDELNERVQRLETELAEASRPWWRRKKKAKPAPTDDNEAENDSQPDVLVLDTTERGVEPLK